MSALPNVQENNEQLLNDIQSLQQMEQQIFNNLESNPNLTADEQQTLIDKMNKLSNMRINLYKTLSGVNNYFENALNTSIGSLKEQAVAITIVETELNSAKKRLQLLEEEKNNKIRLVEINTYYGEKYEEHAGLMKIIIFTLIPVIIFTVLHTKGLLPTTIYYLLLIVISFIGGYYFWKKFASIIMRDNMNYQEYVWYFNPSAAPTTTSTTATDPWSSNISSLNFGTCIGDACCSNGLSWDSSLNQCIGTSTVAPASSTATSTASVTPIATSTASSTTNESFITESMINNILTKTDPYKNNKIDYNLRPPTAYK